jgi:two-component system, cell cycle sensor histidine kinase and response regulator CckA
MNRVTATSESRHGKSDDGTNPGAEPVRILVVDDDPQANALIEMALADAHFEREVEVVGTAFQGLRRIDESAHDVYIVDYKLPDQNGLELIREAKSRGATRPFILMTGHGSGAVDEAALREGVADYVEKHMLSAHLERSIRYAIRDWHAEQALREREDQLRQAQKMEAIGRLAGGVAHDFNNLLTAVIGYADAIAERDTTDDSARRDVAEIRKAADRAASLTRQLLAFGRKQFLRPVVLDLNETVTGLLQMLPRVIGENIQTVPRLAKDLARVTADPSQMEQVLVNLVLNARDAMPMGGTISIETANVELTAANLAEGVRLQPGSYVMLTVSDTGTGMDATTRARAFEPFFTTKPKGKGTGLGLATVYGIVDQTGGEITIKTALGHGTIVRIYLPAVAAPADRREADPPRPAKTFGNESVMVVEDNDAVRELAIMALRQRGYDVLEAASAEQALDLIAQGARPQLLLTDVVMPGLSGPNLAARLLQHIPRLRVLYMSGYSEDAAAAHGTFWGGVPLLQKPFTSSQLAERVRLTLDTANGPA